MLEMALKAELPLITIQTDDTVNVGDTLAAMVGFHFKEVPEQDVGQMFSAGSKRGPKYYFVVAPEVLNWHEVYQSCVAQNRVLVAVNPRNYSPIPFNAGWLKIGPRQIKQLLDDIVMDEDLPHIINAFSGLSLKDMGEIIQISMTEYDELTVERILHLRRLVSRTTKGLTEVETDCPAYIPEKQLKDWFKVDGTLLMDEDTPSELVPRGLLFGGEPGTGKTEGAKYIAHELGIPLYRLDLGALMNKYVGESESNLDRLLAIVDKSEPCVLLIDEVEKIFQSSDDSGVTSRLLSQLLWWLQEHASRVFTIMTTNNADSLPQELWRPGRIDQMMVFKGLLGQHATIFLEKVYNASLGPKLGIVLEDNDYAGFLIPMYKKLGKNTARISQSALVQGLHTYIKKLLTIGD